jgi:hypothetical protein
MFSFQVRAIGPSPEDLQDGGPQVFPLILTIKVLLPCEDFPPVMLTLGKLLSFPHPCCSLALHDGFAVFVQVASHPLSALKQTVPLRNEEDLKEEVWEAHKCMVGSELMHRVSVT